MSRPWAMPEAVAARPGVVEPEEEEPRGPEGQARRASRPGSAAARAPSSTDRSPERPHARPEAGRRRGAARTSRRSACRRGSRSRTAGKARSRARPTRRARAPRARRAAVAGSLREARSSRGAPAVAAASTEAKTATAQRWAPARSRRAARSGRHPCRAETCPPAASAGRRGARGADRTPGRTSAGPGCPRRKSCRSRHAMGQRRSQHVKLASRRRAPAHPGPLRAGPWPRWRPRG